MKGLLIAFSGCLLLGHVYGSVPEPTASIILTAAPPYTATGELFLLRADPEADALRNPVFVVEGFDIDNSMGWEALYTLLNQEHLAEEMRVYGRDLLVLNFTDSTRDILDNSALTAAAITYINANRADPDDKFTVVGASLGGLTTRKALVEMLDPDVDTWISFDAPHEGANIPLGIQEFFAYFSNVNLPDFDVIRDYLDSIDAPASRQLLLVHHRHQPDAPSGGSDPDRADFVDVMNTVGYPTRCKTIAISNGSGYGEKLPFSAGALMVHWNYDGGGFLDPNIDADIYALPLSQSVAATVFYGRFQAFLVGQSPQTVQTYYPLALDHAPGGTRSSFQDVFDSLPPAYLDGDDYCAYSDHCFVPTVSALGIPIEHLVSNLAAHASLAAMSPFDEIHYAARNEEHVEINTNNKPWLVRALLEDVDTDGDGFDDYQEYLMGTTYDAAGSKLDVVQVIEPVTIGGALRVVWDRLPNTQYEVWHAESLNGGWSWIETLQPSVDPLGQYVYAPDSVHAAVFFRIIAYPVDPVVD